MFKADGLLTRRIEHFDMASIVDLDKMCHGKYTSIYIHIYTVETHTHTHAHIPHIHTHSYTCNTQYS